MSREQILAAIRECAAELKRNPRISDLARMKKINYGVVEGRFGRWSLALRAAGLKPQGQGIRNAPDALLLDWARLARKLGKLPPLALYKSRGRYSLGSFRTNFGYWSHVPRLFHSFAVNKGIAAQWKDVLAMIAEKERSLFESPKLDPDKHRPDRPLYGSPLLCPGVAHEPVNESGVIYVFGALAQRLGFVMLRMQTGFPDCEAMREVGPGHWQRVRIEFEFASNSFKHHGHRTQDCDMIVCWIHNWPSCPKQLEVLELRKIVRGS